MTTNEEALNYIQHKLDLAVDDPLIMTDKEYEIFSLCAKALKREPCEDAISRQAMEKITWEEPSYTDALNVLTEVREKVRAMPPVTPRSKWIPVNEQLPKENEWYQCTVILDYSSLTMDLFYKNGKWLDNRAIKMFNTYDIYGYGNSGEKHKLLYRELISEFDWTEKVVAWMPSPKPYKADVKEEEE